MFSWLLLLKMASSSGDNNNLSNNENPCLKYIEDSFKLLEQARAAALNNTSSSLPSPANQTNSQQSWSESDVNKEFRESFPGLSRRSSGKHLQTYLPSSGSGSRRSSNPYQCRSSNSKVVTSWSGKVANTWTHDFVCLTECGKSWTPTVAQSTMLRKAGLGKKRIIFEDKYGHHDHVRKILEDNFPRYVVYFLICLYFYSYS